MNRSEYPICPVCGGRVAAAAMTSGAINPDGSPFDPAVWRQGDRLFYPPESLWVYCVNAACNYDHQLSDLTTPVPAEVGA